MARASGAAGPPQATSAFLCQPRKCYYLQGVAWTHALETHAGNASQRSPQRGTQAQSRRNLCVWYGLADVGAPFLFEIEGTVQGIERSAGATEVLVQEDPAAGDAGVVGYQLDDSLVRAAPAMAALQPGCASQRSACRPPNEQLHGWPDAHVSPTYQICIESARIWPTRASLPCWRFPCGV